MSRTITVNGVDRTSLIRLDSTVWVEVAHRGDVGLGGYIMDDISASLDVPALKDIVVAESSASPVRLHTGFIADRVIKRGQMTRVSSERQWSVMVTDINALLDDQLLSSESKAKRPAETDYDRIQWLLSTVPMNNNNVSAGQVPNTNKVQMDPLDHGASFASDVLDDCAQKSGKNYFLYNYGSGNKLFYDLATGSGLTSSLQVSTVTADVDGSTCFAPIGDPGMTKSPIDIYSNVRLVYAKGAVSVVNHTTESNFRPRSVNIEATNVKTVTRATEKAQKYLDEANDEDITIDGIRIIVPAANVNDIRAGQRLRCKFPHLGYASFTYFRCTRREVRPAPGDSGVSGEMYDVTLDVAVNVFPTTFAINDKRLKR